MQCDVEDPEFIRFLGRVESARMTWSLRGPALGGIILDGIERRSFGR